MEKTLDHSAESKPSPVTANAEENAAWLVERYQFSVPELRALTKCNEATAKRLIEGRLGKVSHLSRLSTDHINILMHVTENLSEVFTPDEVTDLFRHRFKRLEDSSLIDLFEHGQVREAVRFTSGLIKQKQGRESVEAA